MNTFLYCLWYIASLNKTLESTRNDSSACLQYLISETRHFENSDSRITKKAVLNDVLDYELELDTNATLSLEETRVEDVTVLSNHLLDFEVSSAIDNNNSYFEAGETLPMFEDFISFEKLTTQLPKEDLDAEVFTFSTLNGAPSASDVKIDPTTSITEFDSDFATERVDNFYGDPSLVATEQYESSSENFTTGLDLETSSSYGDPAVVPIEPIPVTLAGLEVEASSPYESSESLQESLFEDIRTEIQFKTTTPIITFTEGLNEHIFDNLDTGVLKEMNTTFFDSTDVISRPDVNLVNKTLCEWYLPTVEQTPIALGNIGIALWVLGFVITFILMVLFAKQGYFIYKTAHKVYRRHLYAVTSVYVVIAMFTSIGSGIPRAHAICSGIKDVYMCIGIGHFVDLTIDMYGSEQVMAYYCRDKAVNLRSILVCKCFICIPRCKVKKRSITILKWLIWQMKWTQAGYYFLRLIINKSTENSLGVADPHSVKIWYLQSLNLLSFITGVAALLLVRTLVVDDLQERYNYNIKAKIVRFTILTTKLQRLIFDILEASNVFPCFPPYVSQKFYKNVLKDFIYLSEVLILGLLTYFSYNKTGEFEHPNSKEIPQPMVKPEEEEEEAAEEEEPDKNGNPDSKLIVSLDQKLGSTKESTC